MGITTAIKESMCDLGRSAKNYCVAVACMGGIPAMLQDKYNGDTQMLEPRIQGMLDPLLSQGSQIPRYGITAGLVTGAVMASKDLKGLLLTYVVGFGILATPSLLNQLSGEQFTPMATIVTEHSKGMLQDFSDGAMTPANISDVYIPMLAATIRYGVGLVRKGLRIQKSYNNDLQ
jgi:hypothetical protein